jgi:hypothetical protein
MTYRGLGYVVDYYSVPILNHPTIVFRGFMRGEPVPFTISLFTIIPSRIYTVGYYSGYGFVAVNLRAPEPGLPWRAAPRPPGSTPPPRAHCQREQRLRGTS